MTPQNGPAIAERHAERLRLHGDNVGLDRRPHDAERNRLGNRHDQQRALRVRDRRNRRNVFNDAEEVGALDQDGRGLVRDRRFQRFEIDAAGLGVVANQRRRQLLVLRVRRQHLAVLRMHGRGDHGLVAAGHAHGHHDRLGRAGRTVVHAGVGHVHAGQLGDHGLELEDGLQRALRYLAPGRACSR